MKKFEEYILWLPSWYPNELEPYNGDFIQRHAVATSNYCKIVVFHFMQLGATFRQNSNYFKKDDAPNLIEYRITPSFIPTGNKLLDKIVYNYKYYNYAKKFLEKYFEENGLPIKVHVHIPLKAGNLALWIKRKYKIDYVLSEHSSHYIPISSDSYFSKSCLYKMQVRKIFKAATTVSNVSATVGQVLREIFTLKKIQTIHNVVNTEYFKYTPEKSRTFTFIHVSSLNKQKNIYGVLNAFEQLKKTNKNWHLKIVGPFTTKLINYIDLKGLSNNVILTGEISYENVAKQMQQSHAFVLFSNHENFPCVVIEALCCGLPIISSNIAGVKEAVNAENGLLVPPNDEKALLKALIYIEKNYKLFKAKEISEKAQKLYNYRTIGKQIFNLYSNTLFP